MKGYNKHNKALSAKKRRGGSSRYGQRRHHGEMGGALSRRLCGNSLKPCCCCGYTQHYKRKERLLDAKYVCKMGMRGSFALQRGIRNRPRTHF
jgi:hypothetical protein